MFDQDDLVYSYTRENMLDDGTLVDVSDLGKVAGFVCPVAVTKAVYEAAGNIPKSWPRETQKERLGDIVWLAVHALRLDLFDRESETYPVTMPCGRKRVMWFKAVLGPGDSGEMVCTIMLPNES